MATKTHYYQCSICKREVALPLRETTPVPPQTNTYARTARTNRGLAWTSTTTRHGTSSTDSTQTIGETSDARHETSTAQAAKAETRATEIAENRGDSIKNHGLCIDKIG